MKKDIDYVKLQDVLDCIDDISDMCDECEIPSNEWYSHLKFRVMCLGKTRILKKQMIGYWKAISLPVPWEIGYECSNCGCRLQRDMARTEYCYRCGAEMIGE